MAERKVQYVKVSTKIRSQSQLFWHRSDMEVHPCRTCERDEAMCLPGIPETWDEKRKVLVQYIVYPNVGQLMLVSRKQLTPYHGHGSGSNKRKVQRANGTMVGGGSWCENLMERYRKQRSKQLRNGSISSGGTIANGGKRVSKAKKGKSAPVPSRDDVRVDVLVQTLYLQKVLDSVRSQEASRSDENSDSDTDRSMPDASIGRASGSNWGSKMKQKDTGDGKKKDDSSCDSEGEEQGTSWSQEWNSRLEAGNKKQTTTGTGSRGAKSKYNSVSSSEDSNDEDEDDDEGTEPKSFSQERDSRMEVKNGASSSTTATAKPKSRGQDVGSDSSSTSSDEELRQDSARRRLNDSVETNESISLSSDSSESESEEETGPIEEEPLRPKRRRTGRSSKARVSFAGTPSTHDEDDCNEGGSDDDVEEDDDHEPMDIPYTQALGLESDDDYLPPPILDPENIKSKEPIRPGDVIEYSSFLFVAGDKRGHREARVISVDPKRDPALVLGTGDVLPNDTKIRRIKVLVGDKLRAHAGVSRPIQSFVLEKAVMKGRSDKISAGFAKEASRVGGIIRRNMAKFQEKAEADGFAPMDVMNKYKGTNFDSSGGASMTTNERGKKKKTSGLSPIDERPKNGFTVKSTRPFSNEGNRKKKSTHESSQSSVLSESSSSDSEEEQPTKSPPKPKTKWIASKQQRKKKHAGASHAVDLSSSSNDDDIMFESPSLRLPTIPNRSGINRTKDRGDMSSASSSSSDSENSWDERKKSSSNKRKSSDVKKTPKRDVWDTSPRKKISAAKKKTRKKDEKHDSLSFESSDDDFEPKGRKRMITVSDKKKKQIKTSSSSKKKAKAKKNSSPSSPLIDMTSSDEKEKDGWMQRLGERTKKPKPSNATKISTTGRRRKKKKEEASGDGNSGVGTGEAPPFQSASAFSLRRAK